MSIQGTKAAPHHEERWTIDKGKTSEEIALYVAHHFGSGALAHPVGWSYAPLTGDLTLFYQVKTQHSKVIGHHEHEAHKAAVAAMAPKVKATSEEPVKPIVAQGETLPEPVGEDVPTIAEAHAALGNVVTGEGEAS